MPPKVILITGASKGIGAATATLAAQRGYDLAVNYNSDRAGAETTAEAARQTGSRAITVAADVADDAAVIAMFETVDAEFGRLDALVCSAGITTPRQAIADTPGADFQRLMAVNVIGTMLCCREAVRRMSTERGGTGGAIVNVSSMAATIGGRPQRAAYAASKAAVDAFTKGLAKDVATQGIRVNAIRPGMTLTPMTSALRDPQVGARFAKSIAMNRIAGPEEIAAPILWLLSDEASFISGDHMDAGGGGFVIEP